MAETVKFDPGLGELAENFNEHINDLYSQLLSLGSIAKKRIKFKMSCPKIEKMMKNNIGFYAGCLLWAYHISQMTPAKEIGGNSFLYMTDEQTADYDYMLQVNFMENYLDSYERDVLYYAGKKFTVPEIWENILSLYSEFLELNKGFTKTKYTSDIILPEKLKNKKITTDIEILINKAIESKDLSLLISDNIFA